MNKKIKELMVKKGGKEITNKKVNSFEKLLFLAQKAEFNLDQTIIIYGLMELMKYPLQDLEEIFELGLGDGLIKPKK